MVEANERFGRIPRVVVLFVGLLGPTAAQAADRFVSTTGSDTANDCLTSASPCLTLTHAVAQAASGDTVKIAGGTYAGTLSFSASVTLTLSAGWTATFGLRDPEVNLTKFVSSVQIDAGPGAVIDVTVDGMTITHNGSFSLVRATAADTGSVTLGLNDCVLRGTSGFPFPPPSGLSVSAADTGSVAVTIADSVIEGNRIGLSAGAAGNSTVDIVATNLVVRKNRDRDKVVPDGCGILLRSLDSGALSATLTASTIQSNGPGFETRGGGIYASREGGVLELELDGSTVSKNRAPEGAGIWAAGSDLVLINSGVFRNGASDVGGGLVFYGYGAQLSLTNSTIAGNRAPTGGGLVVNSSSADLLNAIVWGNRALSGVDLATAPSTVVNADHSDIGQRVVAGTFNDLGGNIDADPLLRSRNRDVHIRPGSPAIDTGTCTGAPTTDFDGDPRPTGAGCDMGADEFVP